MGPAEHKESKNAQTVSLCGQGNLPGDESAFTSRWLDELRAELQAPDMRHPP